MRKKRGLVIAGLVISCFLLVHPALRAQGNFEFGVHYGHWSLNLLKSAIEGVVDDLAQQIKDKQLDKIKEEHREFRELTFANDFSFDSGGPNFGFEFRWYPAGQEGSFSLGLSVEKTTFRISVPSVSTTLTLEDMKTHQLAGFKATAGATIESKPLAFLLSVRWDILPTKRVHPYFTLGLGLAGESALLKSHMTYNFRGLLTDSDGTQESIEESGSKTVQQLMDEDKQRKIDEGLNEEPFKLPIHFMPFLQLHFGLKGVITKNVQALIDFGILDGFLLRGGIAIRI